MMATMTMMLTVMIIMMLRMMMIKMTMIVTEIMIIEKMTKVYITIIVVGQWYLSLNQRLFLTVRALQSCCPGGLWDGDHRVDIMIGTYSGIDR